MNRLQNLKTLHNRYFALRHGKSRANEEGIIISSPEAGIRDYGLVMEGRQQVRDAISQAVDEGLIDDKVIIYSSDFKRACETAEIAHQFASGIEAVRLTPKLRERFFGAHEGKSNKHYEEVWKVDAKYPHHRFDGVESAEEVLVRTTELIVNIESCESGKKVILASHGDPLQILATGFGKISPKHHREIPHFQTGELRELHLATTVGENSLTRSTY